MDIETTMLAEIEKQHTKTQDLIEQARHMTSDAVDQALVVAELINKAKASKKNSLNQWITENTSLSRTESTAYLSARHVQQKRDLKKDKRGLQLLGILEKAEPPNRVATRCKPSLSCRVNKMNGTINRDLIRRPVENMSELEALQLRESVRPLAELFVKLSKAK